MPVQLPILVINGLIPGKSFLVVAPLERLSEIGQNNTVLDSPARILPEALDPSSTTASNERACESAGKANQVAAEHRDGAQNSPKTIGGVAQRVVRKKKAQAIDRGPSIFLSQKPKRHARNLCKQDRVRTISARKLGYGES